MNIEKRIFICGTARSGTTLLQSLFAAHPMIYSPAESHYFSKTMDKQKWLRFFKSISSSKIRDLNNFHKSNGNENLCLPEQSYSKEEIFSQAEIHLDQLSHEANKRFWVEKTPMHIYFIEGMIKHIQNAHIIINVRAAIPTISSLYVAGQKHSDAFKKATIDELIARYNKEFEIAQEYVNHPQVSINFYEDLVESPEKQIRKLCSHIGIAFDDKMLETKSSAKYIVNENEAWKNANSQEIAEQNDKFSTYLSEQQQAKLLEVYKDFSPKKILNA